MNLSRHSSAKTSVWSACAGLATALIACQVPNPAYNIAGQDVDAGYVQTPLFDADADVASQPDVLQARRDAPAPAVDALAAPDGSSFDVPLTSIVSSGCDPSNPDLLLCLRFEDNLIDQSGKPHTLQGLPQFVDGANGRALDLGLSQTLTSAPSSNLAVARFSAEAWVQGESLPALKPALLFEASGIVALWIEPSGRVVCQLGGSSGPKVEATTSFTSTVWKAFACTYDGTELAIVANGFIAGSRNVGAWTPSVTEARVQLVETLQFARWQGGLDNVRFWRRRLSPPQLWFP